MQSSCFGNILVRIRGTAESEAIRPPCLPLPPSLSLSLSLSLSPSLSLSSLLDAIFTCGGGEEITVKAREFAFVEISRNTSRYHSTFFPPLSQSTRFPLLLYVLYFLLSSGFRHNLCIFAAESFPRIRDARLKRESVPHTFRSAVFSPLSSQISPPFSRITLIRIRQNAIIIT
jgi:hypothetical protein